MESLPFLIAWIPENPLRTFASTFVGLGTILTIVFLFHNRSSVKRIDKEKLLIKSIMRTIKIVTREPGPSIGESPSYSLGRKGFPREFEQRLRTDSNWN